MTPLTGNKFERGGKGFGRFIAFKLFDKVFYSSRHIDPNGAATAGTYRYKPFAADDNLIPVASDDGAGVHRFDLGLTARMHCRTMKSRPISIRRAIAIQPAKPWMQSHSGSSIIFWSILSKRRSRENSR